MLTEKVVSGLLSSLATIVGTGSACVSAAGAAKAVASPKCRTGQACCEMCPISCGHP